MSSVTAQLELYGVPISEGIAMGSLCCLKTSQNWSIPEYSIKPSEVESEIDRYRVAIAASREELEGLKEHLLREGSKEAVDIIGAQIHMLEDPLITSNIEEKILSSLKNTESVFMAVVDEYFTLFPSRENSEVYQRLLDIKDLLGRIMRHLNHDPQGEDSRIPTRAVVASFELIPSYVAEASPNHILGFISQIGGATSHASLIAKAKGIPYVSNIETSLLEAYEGETIIIDGTNGIVFVNPTVETIDRYKKEKDRAKEQRQEEEKENFSAKVVTKDGIEIQLQANLESLHDIHLLKEYNIHSIGLVRSEFLYLRKEASDFDEERQFQLYKKMMQLAGNIEVTFRFFDLGSDKNFFDAKSYEPNPALGCRSIRFLMNHPEIFSAQIRAILRASAYGKLKLLLPLISDLAELKASKALIEKERQSLEEAGVYLSSEIPIGCMVEVPAFVIMCDELVKECDFLSIGTNDLVQYTLVADRSNPLTCNRYGAMHPSIIRMIQHVLKEAEKEGIPVSICGEIASNPYHTEELVKIGVRSFSCVPRSIPLIRKAIAATQIHN